MRSNALTEFECVIFVLFCCLVFIISPIAFLLPQIGQRGANLTNVSELALGIYTITLTRFVPRFFFDEVDLRSSRVDSSYHPSFSAFVLHPLLSTDIVITLRNLTFVKFLQFPMS